MQTVKAGTGTPTFWHVPLVPQPQQTPGLPCRSSQAGLEPGVLPLLFCGSASFQPFPWIVTGRPLVLMMHVSGSVSVLVQVTFVSGTDDPQISVGTSREVSHSEEAPPR